MATVFGLPCTPLPPIGDIVFSAPLSPFDNFVKSIFANPNYRDKHSRFFYSKLFFFAYVWYVVFRLPREMSRLLNAGLGINFSILLVINVVFAFEMFRRYGYECTLLLVAMLYFVYTGLLMLLPAVAKSEVGEVLPELKELPVSQRTPGLNHCRRLAVCRATPVFDNHRFQQGKYRKCLACASGAKPKKIVFDETAPNCGSKERDVDAEKCYKCSSADASTRSCRYSDADCADVNMVLDMLDSDKTEYRERQRICKEASGSLCWFQPVEGDNSKGLGWNQPLLVERNTRHQRQDAKEWDLSDANANGHGFPTKEICEREIPADLGGTPSPGVTCKRLSSCAPKTDAAARCVCEQYRDVRQYRNPCEFLEANCDDTSVAYTEAVLRIKQADIGVDDIISVDDAKNFLDALDTVAERIP